jgi:uncharacterized protein (DUF58 family)
MDLFKDIDVRQLDHLDLLAKQVVEGFIIGLHKSPFHGFSVEFAEHRLHNIGDSTRNIDWKVYARTDRMYTKKYEEETNLRCQIVIDTSSSMQFPETGEGRPLNKLRFSAIAAAALMNLLRRQRDAFGLSLFSEDLEVHTRAKSSTTHYKLLLSYLEKALDQDGEGKRTSATASLHQIADAIHKRSLVIIFTDMFDNSQGRDDLFDAIQHLKHNKHEVIIFQVIDKSLEVEFEYSNRPYLFRDVETGEEVKLQAEQVKEYYRKNMREFQESVRQKALKYRVDYEVIDIRKDIFKTLQTYLVKRAKMSI